MFGNALFNPSNAPLTPGRRHSHLDVSLAPKVNQRRATSPVINIDGMSPGLGYMHAPSTPCFVTPTLGGFSGRRFSYDSPLQTLTSLSSGGLPTLNRKAAKRAWATMSTKKWSRPCKMVMIMLLTSFAITLFLLRKSRESSVPVEMRHVNPPCNEHAGTCDVLEAHQHENNIKEEFMGMVTETEHYHELEEENNLWSNRWTDQGVNPNEEISGSQNSGNEDLQVNVVEQEPIGLDDLPSKVMGYVESVKSFIGDKMQGSESNDGSAELHEGSSQIQDAALEVSSVEISEITQSHDTNLHMDTSWPESDNRHAVQHPEMLPNQGIAQIPQANMPVPPHPGHMQPPQPLHPHGQAPAQQQYHDQGMQLQQPAGHLRPPQPQVIGVPAHHMPQQQYAHMPNAGQPLPPGVNPLRYNQYPQPHNQYPQPHYNHNQGNIIGHNPQHHQNNWGQKLPPGVNPNHYRGL